MDDKQKTLFIACAALAAIWSVIGWWRRAPASQPDSMKDRAAMAIAAIFYVLTAVAYFGIPA